MTWTSTINSWEGNDPEFHDFLFASWISWLVLYLTYRYVFAVPKQIVSNFQLMMVHLMASYSYVIDKYFINLPYVSDVILGIYLAVVVITFAWLLIRPLFQTKDALFDLPKCMQSNKALFTMGLLVFAIIYRYQTFLFLYFLFYILFSWFILLYLFYLI